MKYFLKTKARMSAYKPGLSSNSLLLLVSLFILCFTNYRFAANVLTEYPLSLSNLAFLASLGLLLFSVNTLLLSFVCIKWTTKPVLIVMLLLSASAAYFMDTYNVIIDDVMIDNIIRTDRAEVSNLISPQQVAYILLLGLIPAIVLLKTKVRPASLAQELIARGKLIAASIAITTVVLFSFGSNYASFFREHKLLRYYTNPTYIVYSAGYYLQEKTTAATNGDIAEIGLDATSHVDAEHRKLIVLVVGETLRSDHMSLNGYGRNTNPLLTSTNAVSFDNVWSCGTSTAVSVPCMFSSYTRDQYNAGKVKATENVLDILARTGINVAWLDNNSDSKGVALRIDYESFKSDETNDHCDDECRDVGMLDYLQDYVAEHDSGDIVLVLHQMGNHGPAYFRRYPAEFEIFTPACKTNILENCSKEEIINSYDNAIVYTDYFLNETIELLKNYDDQFATAMVYIGDHGESLGEYGLYLHGLPYSLAPDTQKHVPLIMWFNEEFKAENVGNSLLGSISGKEYSHDNMFHTILGLAQVSTTIYDERLDITSAP